MSTADSLMYLAVIVAGSLALGGGTVALISTFCRIFRRHLARHLGHPSGARNHSGPEGAQVMPKNRPGVLDGNWTSEPQATECPCGEAVYFLVRGTMRLIPRGHQCRFRSAQEDQVRTIRAIESAGIRVTEGEARRRLNVGRSSSR